MNAKMKAQWYMYIISTLASEPEPEPSYSSLTDRGIRHQH